MAGLKSLGGRGQVGERNRIIGENTRVIKAFAQILRAFTAGLWSPPRVFEHAEIVVAICLDIK